MGHGRRINCRLESFGVTLFAYSMGQKVLTVAFLTPAPDDHWMNRLTGRVSLHPYCHVELFFECSNMCFSIEWGEFAGFRFKNLSNPNYHLVSLCVPAREYDTCLDFCRVAATHHMLFDNIAMWRAWFPPCLTCTPCDPSSQSKKRTFCSKIITEALQFAGVREVERLTPAATTPSVLFHAVVSSPRKICSGVPYKRQALMQLSKGVTGLFTPPPVVRMG